MKLNTILKENSEEEKDDDNTKLKDDIFNTPAALKKYINLTVIVKEGEDGLYFQIIDLVSGYTKEKLQVLLNLTSFMGEEN